MRAQQSKDAEEVWSAYTATKASHSQEVPAEVAEASQDFGRR